MAKKSKEKKPSERRPTEKDILNKKRLELEIKERAWNVALMGKLVKLAPLFTPLMLAVSILASVYWYTKQWNLQMEQQRLEAERQRQETITNLKREFASDNPAIRIGAALALADYPKEAVHVLISSLGEEDIAFTTTVKDSLRHVGNDALEPLANELKRLKEEAKNIISPREGKFFQNVESTIEKFYFSFDTLLYKPFEQIRHKIKKNDSKHFYPGGLFPQEIDSYIDKLRALRSEKPRLKVAHKNILEVIEDLLKNNHVKGLQLSGIDLSGANLEHANLIDADLHDADLSSSHLTHTNLSNANLTNSNLSGAIISVTLKKIEDRYSTTNVDNINKKYKFVTETKLVGADLRGANLNGVKVCRYIVDFSGVVYPGFTFSDFAAEDLKFIVSMGAIIDDTTKMSF